MAAKSVRALRGKCGQANVRCDWSEQILLAWLANGRNVEHVEGVLVLMNLDGVLFTAITGDAFDLR